MPRNARLVATLPGIVSAKVSGLPGGGLAMVDTSGELVITDAEFTVVRTLATPSRGQGCDAVRGDLERVALALDDGIRLLAGDGSLLRTLRHDGLPGHGACAFAGDSRLWAVLPRSDGGTDIALLELDDLTVADRRDLGATPVGLDAFRHPDGAVMGWAVGEGQDRAVICWTSIVDGRVEIRQAPTDDRVLVAIHESGDEYLTSPHYDGPLQRHTFATDAVVAECPTDAEDGWDFAAGYLDADYILAATRREEEGSELTLLAREPFDVVDTVMHAGGINAWRTLAWCGGGRWVTVGAAGVEMWAL